MNENAHDSAGVVFPPPFIYLGFLLAGFGIDWFLPLPLLPITLAYATTIQFSVGGLLIALALSIFISAILVLRRGKTAIRPDRATSTIMTTGPFRHTRNPLYLALTIIHAGIAVMGNSIWVLLMLIPVLVIMQRSVIGREERYLEGKFGDVYRAYRSSVRRWI